MIVYVSQQVQGKNFSRFFSSPPFCHHVPKRFVNNDYHTRYCIVIQYFSFISFTWQVYFLDCFVFLYGQSRENARATTMIAVDADGVVYWFLFLSVLLLSFCSASSFYAIGNGNGFRKNRHLLWVRSRGESITKTSIILRIKIPRVFFRLPIACNLRQTFI